MVFKRTVCWFALLAILFCGICEIPVSAEELENSLEIYQATRCFSTSIPGKSMKKGNTSFSLAAGEEVLIRVVYTPKSAKVDFGIVSADGVFYYVKARSEIDEQTIIVEKDGEYAVAVRNNSEGMISISGFVS